MPKATSWSALPEALVSRTTSAIRASRTPTRWVSPLTGSRSLLFIRNIVHHQGDARPDDGCSVPRSYNLRHKSVGGGMAERTNALVLKTRGGRTPEGSNPSAPAFGTGAPYRRSFDANSVKNC